VGIQSREIACRGGSKASSWGGLLSVSGLLRKIAEAVLEMVSKSFEQGVAERTGSFISKLERFHHG